MSRETTYGEALNYLEACPKVAVYKDEISEGEVWSMWVSRFEEKPDGVRQALINRLIGIQKEQRYRADEKRNEWREKYGGDEE